MVYAEHSNNQRVHLQFYVACNAYDIAIGIDWYECNVPYEAG